MEKTIFEKIIDGKIPCHKIYEDDLFIAFLDIAPRTKGHTLVVPKKHTIWVYDVPEFDKYWMVAHKIVRAMQKSLNPHYVSLQTWGLQVPHAHIHVIPIYSVSEKLGDRLSLPQAEMEEIASKIRSAIEL